MLHECRQAVRALRSTPYATLGAVLTLGLGLGASGTMLTIVDRVLLRPLDLPDSGRVVRFLRLEGGRLNDAGWLLSSWQAYQRLASFQGVAAYGGAGVPPLLLDASDRVVPIEALAVSSNYFQVLGRQLPLGPGILPQDEARGAAPVLVISDALWRSHFQSSPDVVGRSLRLNQTLFTIVGVAPPGRHRPDIGPRPDVFVSMRAVLSLLPFPMNIFDTESDPAFSPVAYWRILGRLRTDVTTKDAQAELTASRPGSPIATSSAGPSQARQAALVSASLAALPVSTRDDATRFVWLLVGTVLLLFVLACASVINLLLARLDARRTDLAVRIAIGAPRFHVIRLAVAEPVLIVAAGSALAVAVMYAMLWTLRSFGIPGFITLGDLDLSPDLRLVLAMSLVATVAAVLCAVGPAIRAVSTNAVEHLSRRPGTHTGGWWWDLQSTLVSLQVAVALVLLIAGGLFARSIGRVLSRDFGFPVDRVLLGSVVMSDRYSAQDAERAIVDAAADVRDAYGAAGVAVGPSPLGQSYGVTALVIDGQEYRMPTGRTFTVDLVEPGYLTNLGVAILQGRDLLEGDRADGQAAVINQAMAATFESRISLLGRSVSFLPFRQPLTVVGVAANARWSDINSGATPSIYLLRRNAPAGLGGTPSILVKLSSGMPRTGDYVRRALRSRFPDLPDPVVRTLKEDLAAWMEPQRLALTLFGWLGSLGAVVGTVGLGALVASGVALQKREVAIRCALGSSAERVHYLMALRGARPLIVGTLLGLLGAVVARNSVRTFLIDVSPVDLPTFFYAASLLLVVAITTIVVVVRRGIGSDLMVTLRSE